MLPLKPVQIQQSLGVWKEENENMTFDKYSSVQGGKINMNYLFIRIILLLPKVNL